MEVNATATPIFPCQKRTRECSIYFNELSLNATMLFTTSNNAHRSALAEHLPVFCFKKHATETPVLASTGAFTACNGGSKSCGVGMWFVLVVMDVLQTYCQHCTLGKVVAVGSLYEPPGFRLNLSQPRQQMRIVYVCC